MNTENEIVFDFEQREVIRSHKKQTKNLVAVLYFLYIACSLTALFLSLRIAHVSFAALVSSKLTLVVLLIERLFPITALLLFIFSKRVGWSLILIFCIVEFLYKGPFMFSVITNWNSFMGASHILLLLALFSFVFSITISILLFHKSIVSLLGISLKRKIVSIGAGVFLFLVIKYMLIDILTDIANGVS